MLEFNEIKRYSQKVCDQVRWKKAKPMIAQEIESHIIDQRDAYMGKGENEQKATQKAIEQMGDPVVIGQSLDKTHRPKPQWAMLTFTGLLIGIGMWADYMFKLADTNKGSFSVANILIVVGIFLVCYFMDFSILGRYAKEIYFCSLIIPFAFPILAFRNTVIAGRIYFEFWGSAISIPTIAFIFPLIFALAVYALQNKGYKGIGLSGVAYLPFALILVATPSIAGLIIYSFSALGVLCFAIVKGWFGVDKKQGLLLVIMPTLMAFAVGISYLWQKDMVRIMSFIEPQVYSEEQGFWFLMVRDFLSNSAFLGKGSIPEFYASAFTSFPTIDSDYLLTYLVHEYGFALLVLVVTLVLVFSVVGIRKVFRQKSMLASLVGMAIMLTFIFQSVFYIMGNTGLSIFEPIALPFVSFGMTAKCINAALVGFMLSIFRTGDVFKDKIRPINKEYITYGSFISYTDGKLIIKVKSSKKAN